MKKINIKEAARILGLSGTVTPKEMKQAYRCACIKYHPDKGGCVEMMKAVNQAWDALQDIKESFNFDHDEPGQADTSGYGDKMNAVLRTMSVLNGLEIEICGSWIWVTGNTHAHKAALKENGLKWASKKKAWYYRPEGSFTSGRGTCSLDDIRNIHGSQKVQAHKHQYRALA